MIELDPFTQVFNGLWALVDNSAALSGYIGPGGGKVSGLISPGNKIKYNQAPDRDPFKDTVNDADTPELILATAGVNLANLTMSSCDTHITRAYQWLITTGDFRVQYRLYPVQFALFAAMGGYANVLAPLTWREKRFVLKSSWLNIAEGQSIPQLNRNLKGWSSIWSITVDFVFRTKDLLTLNAPPE